MLVQGDEEKINHRIPHRFEPLTNIGANWCCHCGYMLPLGRKNARKCSECDITCHANCAHLVPDFCGMSMETANQLLRDWRDINKARGGRTSAPPRQMTRPLPSEPTPDMSPVVGGMDKLRLDQPPVLPPVQDEQISTPSLPSQDRFPPDPRYQQQMGYPPTQSPPISARPPPARIQPPSYDLPPPGAMTARPSFDQMQQQSYDVAGPGPGYAVG